MALGRTARYYKYGTTIKGKSKPGNAKRAKKVKSAKDKEVHSTPSYKKKKSESAKKRYQAKKKGNSTKGKDYDHAVGKFVKSSKNRGRKGEGGRKRVKNKNKGPK
jgi:hypothetical protein